LFLLFSSTLSDSKTYTDDSHHVEPLVAYHVNGNIKRASELRRVVTATKHKQRVRASVAVCDKSQCVFMGVSSEWWDGRPTYRTAHHVLHWCSLQHTQSHCRHLFTPQKWLHGQTLHDLFVIVFDWHSIRTLALWQGIITAAAVTIIMAIL